MDAEGSVYVSELFGERVRKIDSDGIITTVAGGGESLEDGVLATDARLPAPSGVAVDSAGNLFISTGCCEGGQRVRRVDAVTGIITTVAGTGEFGFSGDGGLATEAALGNPAGLAVDAAGNLYIAEVEFSRVRRVDAVSGVITTVAGTGDWGYSGDGGPATEAFLAGPSDLAFDAAGNLYITDTYNGVIRKVDAVTGIITTVAGGGDPANGVGDGLSATEVDLSDPFGLTVTADGTIYFADTQAHRVRRVDTSGIITTVAGTGVAGFSGDGGPPEQARVFFPHDVAVDEMLGVLITDVVNARIRQVLAVPDLLLAIQSDSPDPLNINQQLTYTIDVTNNSAGTATGVTVTDT
ncbi:MAG: DUF11 domain-containing protein, partial [Actinobacteria bacterium]|nr:DUF11 domain-containing protein [Actinomycetota bacterium]